MGWEGKWERNLPITFDAQMAKNDDIFFSRSAAAAADLFLCVGIMCCCRCCCVNMWEAGRERERWYNDGVAFRSWWGWLSALSRSSLTKLHKFPSLSLSLFHGVSYTHTHTFVRLRSSLSLSLPLYEIQARINYLMKFIAVRM